MGQSQSDTRYKFIKANPGKKRPFMKGLWYKCAHCGKWCGRSGSDNVDIPLEIRMEVDHIKPWYNGGSDELWNLQPLCYKCNREKGANATTLDGFKTAFNTIAHPVDAVKSIGRKTVRQSKTLKKFGLNKRK